jgi:dipeptidyl aminopeptidase/acylaminoacyl peptidase
MIPRGFRVTRPHCGWLVQLCILLGVMAGGCYQAPTVPLTAEKAAAPPASSTFADQPVTAVPSPVEKVASPSPATTRAAPAAARQDLAFVRDGDIWLATADGRSALRLTRSGADRQPAWSPDGRRLVFVRGLGEAAELYTIQSDGQGLRRLTSDRVEQRDPTWAPRGELIAFVQRRDADGDRVADAAGVPEIWVSAADGQQARKLVDGFDPAWSPDAQQVAFATGRNGGDAPIGAPHDNELRLIGTAGSGERLLLSPPNVKAAIVKHADFPLRVDGQRLRAPSWRSDGRLLSASGDGRAGALLTVDERGGDTRVWKLTYQGKVGRSVFAPRGTLLAAETVLATSVAHVLLVDTATGREFDIGSEQRDYSAAEPTWSPNGGQLAVVVWPGVASAPGPRELVVFGDDGAVRTRVAAGNLSQPAWNPAR